MCRWRRAVARIVPARNDQCVAYAATGGIAMAYQRFPHAMDPAARKWRDLAERRRAHFVELFESGRWRHYYSDTEFLVEMRKAMAIAQKWAQLAPTAEERARSG